MDELEVLKKAWKQDQHSFSQLTEQDIYRMLHQKSSSIVKWILIISILEFVFWNVISIGFSDEQYQNKLRTYGIEDIMFFVNCVNYAVLVGFIYVFYKNYRSICILDSTKTLMKSILRTRKTVQTYIGYNLFIITLTVIISIVMMFQHNADVASLMQKEIAQGHQTLFIVGCVLISLVFIGIIICVFWLFYRLLYGILLKKLYANYHELKKIEL